jgi:hypothetical protein
MKAKAIFILANWAFSLLALISIVPEHSNLRAVLAVAVWFVCASILLKRADRKGWLNGFERGIDRIVDRMIG